MENKLIILSEEIYKFNKIYFDSLGAHLKIYKNKSNDDSFYRINHHKRGHEQYRDIIFLFDDLRFDSICKTGNFWDMSKHSTRKIPNDVYRENYKRFFDRFGPNWKFVLLDFNNEPIQEPSLNFTKEWLDFDGRNFCISQRIPSQSHVRLLNGLVYLPLINCFQKYGFCQFDKLDYSRPINPKYDFITYLGHTSKKEKRKYRLEKITEILDNDISKLKHKEPEEIIVGQSNYLDGGRGHYWNLLNSLSAKIRLIFENSDLERSFTFMDDYFLTEKTLKCLYYPHPYILFLHDSVLDKLREVGFRFSYNGKTSNDFVELLTEVKLDIPNWIGKNEDDFNHNQNNLFKMINSKNLPHHLFITKILNREI
tara:strand:+ start:498 stop:1598 length:1101 start_codon:yes stop_codon:yes gene_type:complete